jgi:hypothetical protein
MLALFYYNMKVNLMMQYRMIILSVNVSIVVLRNKTYACEVCWLGIVSLLDILEVIGRACIYYKPWSRTIFCKHNLVVFHCTIFIHVNGE